MIWVSFYLEFEGERGQTWVMGHRPKPSQVFFELAVGFGPYVACLVDPCWLFKGPQTCLNTLQTRWVGRSLPRFW